MNTEIFLVKDKKICLCKYKLVVRSYSTLEKTEYTDTTHYVDDDGLYELEVKFVPKHRLLEIVSKEKLDTSEFDWMDGIPLKTDDPAKEIAEIASYGSLEVYEASLPESTDDFKLDIDYRLSKLELGL